MGLTSRTYTLALLHLAFASATTTGGAVGLDLDLWFDLRRANDSHHLSASRAVELLYLATRDALPEEIAIIWREVQAKVLAPVLWGATVACLALSVLLAVEVMFLAAVSLGVKLLRCRPEKRYKWEALCADPEAGSLSFPMVLVQIPMYNEKEVYKLSIGAACGLTWPSDRLIIQVLDDSTDPIIKSLVELECKAWARKGVNVYYEVRENRKGYKAGALKRGMEHSYVEQCDFVAIFDADFQPDPDFLMRAIPYLVHNPKIALVQARWDFGSC